MLDKTPQRIREGRKKINLTQEQLGKKVHVTKQSVSKWETGENLPEPPTMNILADLFDYSIDYLYGRTDEPNNKDVKSDISDSKAKIAPVKPITPAERAEELKEYLVRAGYMKDYNDLSPEQLAIILNTIEGCLKLTNNIREKDED